jgi:pilus assembly protein CpaE
MANTPVAVVVDQDLQSRFDMKQVIKASGLNVAGEANIGLEAVTVALSTRPDVIAVAVNEPMERPLQTVESLAGALPETPIIVYSMSRELAAARRSMLAGARDFLTRPVRPEAFRQSVLKAMEAEENRRLQKAGGTPQAAARGTVIAVFGAKGGIGKSTLATNLAAALAAQNTASVVLADLDTGFGDLSGMLDVRAEARLSELVRDMDGGAAVDLRRYVRRHERSGLDLLAAPSVLEWRSIDPAGVRRAVELLAQHYDIVVLDTAGGLDAITEAAFELSTMVLWVTTSDYASVRDSAEAVRALGTLAHSQDRIRFVVNTIYPDDAVRPQAIAQALGRDVFWVVPYDRRVRQTTHLGQPVVIAAPRSGAAKSVSDLAAAIGGSGAGRRHLLPGVQRPRLAAARAAQP